VPFRVALDRPLRAPDGSLVLPGATLASLDEAGLEWEFLPEHGRELTPDDLDGYDAVIDMATAVTRETVAGAERLALVARHGVGLDIVDVPACTEHGVIVTVTPDGVARPMALGALAMLLALSHRVLLKDAVARKPEWPGRFETTGIGLTGRTLGLIGLGTIGTTLAELVAPMRMRLLAHTPRLTPARAAEAGAEAVSLETLLAESDFVVVACPLNDETRGLLDAERIAQMKRGAHLVNVARGPIVDSDALAAALREGRVAGAATDVFEQEPPAEDDPLLGLDEVLLAPHAIGFTDELFRGTVGSACAAVIAVARGEAPQYMANPEVLDSPRLRARLASRA
jgi:phosphoglycerate dehydrogenase-like enzyme